MNQSYGYYLNADLDEYAGKWVVIMNDKVLASGKNVFDVRKTIEKLKKEDPGSTPLVTKVQEKGLLVL
jgi:hypothetical protein